MDIPTTQEAKPAQNTAQPPINPMQFDESALAKLLKSRFSGEEEGGGVRSGPGEARTILLLHIISVRPSKQPLMVRIFLKVYMELCSYFLFLQELLLKRLEYRE